MGLLDRFKKLPAPKTQRGASGRGHSGGFLEVDELNNELTGQAGLRIFDRMYRSDPDIRRIVALLCNPVVAGEFSIEPYGGDQADQAALDQAEWLRWALFENLRPTFPMHLAEALPLVTRSGFAPFEHVWGTAEFQGATYLVPRKLDVRLPRSIQRWIQDTDGELAAIEQFVPFSLGRLTTPNENPLGLVEIPASQILYYSVGREGDNFEGTPLIRPAYKPWFLKDGIERLMAVKIEREALGIPVLYPPQNVNDGDLEAIETAIASLKAGEHLSITMPGPHAENVDDGSGWRLDIEGLGAGESSSDAQTYLDYCTAKIDASVVAEFMRLGQGSGGTGARATADVQQDPFYHGVQALAEVILDPWNTDLIPRMIAHNFADAEGAPKLLMEKPDAMSLMDLSSTLVSLSGAGMLTIDPELEDHLRDKLGLPAADPEVQKQAQELKAKQDDLALKQGEADIVATKAGATAKAKGPAGAKKPAGGGKAKKFDLAVGECGECGATTYADLCPTCDYSG